jgi:hypothetical protein
MEIVSQNCLRVFDFSVANFGGTWHSIDATMPGATRPVQAK